MKICVFVWLQCSTIDTAGNQRMVTSRSFGTSNTLPERDHRKWSRDREGEAQAPSASESVLCGGPPTV
jgi:hypothetical protein